MKKNLLKWGMALMLPALALTSCSSKNDEVRTTRVTFMLLNHVTPVTTDEAPFITEGSYGIFFNLTERTMNVSTSSLEIDGSKHSLGTQKFGFTAQGYTNSTGGYGEVYSFRAPEGNVAETGSAPVTGMQGKVTPFFYYNTQVQVPGYTSTFSVAPHLAMSYNYDAKYHVTTMYGDSFYSGTLQTTYADKEGQQQTYAPKDPFLYRLVIDAKNSKADVIMYDAVFAEGMPKLTAVIVKGLTLKVTRGGFVAEGKNIVPDLVEGAQATPLPPFVFNDITVASSSSDLTSATFTFSVAGKYSGKFTGQNAFLGQ